MEKQRKCLKCDRMFLSMSTGNRICQRCKGSDVNNLAPIVSADARNKMTKRIRARVGKGHWKANPLLPKKGL